jgi:hypothetical protein
LPIINAWFGPLIISHAHACFAVAIDKLMNQPCNKASLVPIDKLMKHVHTDLSSPKCMYIQFNYIQTQFLFSKASAIDSRKALISSDSFLDNDGSVGG